MSYEYRIVMVGNENDLQKVLDRYSADGWRLAQTYLSGGYTEGFIFERPDADQPAGIDVRQTR